MLLNKICVWFIVGRPTRLNKKPYGLKICLLIVAFVSACAQTPVQGQAPRSPTPASVKGVVDVQTIAKGLEHPWGLAFLPDKRMLVTERPGSLRIVGAGGRISEPLSGVPKVYASGQGGLLDVALSPTFDKDRFVYLSFAESGEGGAGTAVGRGRLGERGLENTQVIWRQQPKVSGSNHWGSRIVFRRDGTLFVTLGERFNHSEKAQDLSVRRRAITRSSTATACGRRSGRTAIVTSKPPCSIPKPISSGPWSTARAVATSSTIRKPGKTTAGRSSPTAPTTLI
jgi:glucose/arabinose dehydrogenase